MPEPSFDGRRRVIIEGISPAVDGGSFPAKRVVGDVVQVEADIFADGHDLISAVMFHRHESDKKPVETRMLPLVNDRWRAEFTAEKLGFYAFTFEAWIDHFATWNRDLKKRADQVQLMIGLEMIRAATARAKARDKKRLEYYIGVIEGDDELQDKVHALTNDEIADLMWRNAERKFVTRHACEMLVEVDPPKAAFSTWYELFPRSASTDPNRHGTLRDVEAMLPRIAKMGIDVLYLPPIHPIGENFRKGKNNKVSADAGDVGSPWAIGGKEGGHKSVHSQLGTIEDVTRLATVAQ